MTCAAAIAVLSTPLLAGAATAELSMPSCAAGDPVVWVNTHTKVYHVSGDAYYGKTKHGKYACKSAALAMGARASHGKASGLMRQSDDGSAPDAAATTAPAMGHHHHRKSGMTMPAPTSTP